MRVNAQAAPETAILKKDISSYCMTYTMCNTYRTCTNKKNTQRKIQKILKPVCKYSQSGILTFINKKSEIQYF